MHRSVVVAALLLAVSACRSSADTAAPGATPTAATAAKAVVAEDFAAVLAMPHRSADNRSRDASRHPAETLAFFEVRPDATVVELWPGGGWYTEILAPYLKADGKLVVTVFDPAGPEAYYGTGQSKALLERAAAAPEVFGTLHTAMVKQLVELGPDGKVAKTTLQSLELGPPDSADVVLTFRNSHGWYRNGALPLVYGAAFRVLRPGGIFGVEQHRAAVGADPEQTAPKGYLPEATVIAAAEAAGFELVERSEIGGNPKDTHDHPDGVWSLPPTLSGGETDRAKFEAIGESDRMTLKFRKPLAKP
ncbi:MAG: methyltransferase [Nannocystaceae bacterium]|nr:methyltransferase [Nannocystaceae bacterium]